MPPLANNQHQALGTQFSSVVLLSLGEIAIDRVYAGVNVSDRIEGWLENYRCPDVAVFLPGCLAQNCGTHWCGGPDFGAEIVSDGDRSREKLDFYALVGMRELLIIDRDPWALELYRLQAGRLVSVGKVDFAHPGSLVSEVLPLTFRLVAGQFRPRIEVTHRESRQSWLA